MTGIIKKYIFLIVMIILALPLRFTFAQEEEISPEHSYNNAIDFYNNLDYNKSTDAFLKALNTANSKLEQWINYNLGNAASSSGQKIQESNPQAAQQAYKQALAFYRRALELDPQDQNAKHNYELTDLKLEQAKEQKKQNQKQQKDEKKNQEQDEQQEKQGQDQDNQGQQQDKQQPEEQQENQGQQGERDRQSAQPQQMTEEQAKMLLENFQNSEDGPTELRQLQQAAGGADVEKDW